MQELTNIIRELVPELMELTFGCEVEYYDLIQTEVDDFRDDIATVIGEKGQIPVMGYLANKTMYETEYRTFPYSSGYANGVKKIIGHPIQLHHVLKAIGKKPNNKEWSYFVGPQGGFHEWFSLKGRLDLRTVAKWDLNKSLSDQSPEVHEFLLSILKK